MFSENKVIIKPLMVGSIVVLYEHFNNSRGLPMMAHYKIGGLAVGASFVSNYVAEMMELPDTLDFVKSPILSGLVFAVSKISPQASVCLHNFLDSLISNTETPFSL